MSKIQEGKVRKGGHNPPPTSPKPSIKPPPQGSRLSGTEGSILGDSAKLFLKQLTQRLPPGDRQHHNLTIDEDGNLILSIMLGECYWPCKLSDEDLLKPVDQLADEIEKMIKSKYAAFVPATGGNQ